MYFMFVFKDLRERAQSWSRRAATDSPAARLIAKLFQARAAKYVACGSTPQ